MTHLRAESASLPQRAMWLILAIAALSTLIWLWRAEIIQFVLATLRWVDDAGAAAPLIYLAAFILAIPLCIPTAPFIIGGGLLFGFVSGSALAFVANTAGGACAFFIARSRLRDRVAGWIKRQEILAALDAAIRAESFKTACLIRMSPILPGPLINYGLGLTRIRRSAYLWASFATVPVIMAYAFLGSTLGRLTDIYESAVDSPPGAMEISLLAVGVFATLSLSWYLGRRAKQILNRNS